MDSVFSFIRRGATAALIAVVSGCAFQPPPAGPSPEESYAARREIVDQCGTINDRASSSVTDFIRTRLLASLSIRNLPEYPIDITLVACTEPMAYALGNGQILFSQGLVRRLPTEAELAFVIAHELAHDILHHQQSLQGDNIDLAPSEYARGLELEADRVALGLVAYAGYDPRSAVNALRHLTSIDKQDAAIAGHPSADERLSRLTGLIKDSGWAPPGIISRRPYQQLRLSIVTDHSPATTTLE